MSDMAVGQAEADGAMRVERDLEAVAKRGTVPRGYSATTEPPVCLSVAYDEQAQVATIAIGPDRPMRPQITRLERGIVAQHDLEGRMARIEITGVAGVVMKGDGDGG
jgi:hypothetical protein